jgi:DNA-binding CsgD family transcriptional regulator
LGVEDSPKIAQALNYSVNTIYSYRNRLRNRAINRDTFDEDIMNIS